VLSSERPKKRRYRERSSFLNFFQTEVEHAAECQPASTKDAEKRTIRRPSTAAFNNPLLRIEAGSDACFNSKGLEVDVAKPNLQCRITFSHALLLQQKYIATLFQLRLVTQARS